MANGKLKIEGQELRTLIRDLDTMEKSLESQIKDLRSTADTVAAGWKGTAASAYMTLQNDVNETTRRLRMRLIAIEEAMKMSADGFDEQEMEEMRRFKNLGGDEAGQSKILDMANHRPVA